MSRCERRRPYGRSVRSVNRPWTLGLVFEQHTGQGVEHTLVQAGTASPGGGATVVLVQQVEEALHGVGLDAEPRRRLVRHVLAVDGVAAQPVEDEMKGRGRLR